MIRINLAKDPKVPKKKVERVVRKKDRPGGAVFMFLLVAAVGGGGYYYYTTFIMPAPEVPQKEPVKPSLPPPVPQTDAPVELPSSLVRTNMAENVVKELDDDIISAVTGGGGAVGASREVNKLNTPYADMTTAEKINYEVLFARNVFDMITRSTPPGIRFRTLEIENFQTVYASGMGSSKEMMQEMFTAFRNERGELLPKPYSHIRDDDKGGFHFTIAQKPRFGLEVGDPFQALDHLGFRESLTDNLINFSRLAEASGFKMPAVPAQVSMERAGSYRRVIYKTEGMSTYKDMHRFVLALYAEKVPVAFKKISMTPVADEQVRVNAEILFTVRE